MEYVSATCASRSTLCGLFLLDRKLAWEDCGGAAAAAAAGAPGAQQRNEKSYRPDELCAFVAKCTNKYAK